MMISVRHTSVTFASWSSRHQSGTSWCIGKMLHEDSGTKEITCDSSVPNLVPDVSALDAYSNQPSIFSLKVTLSYENLTHIQLEDLEDHQRCTPFNLELSVPALMQSPTNIHSICNTVFCPNHVSWPWKIQH